MKPRDKRLTLLPSFVLLVFFLFACAPNPTTALPVIISFEADAKVLAAGGTSTLSWEVQNATKLEITADTGRHIGDVTNQSSAENVTHTETTTHTLTATNAAGSVTETTTVNVITVSSELPADIPVGAQAATLEDAAAFAWQEFIALNWPAAQGVRDTPASSGQFGGSGPVVWETFRHKVEVFPGTGTPHGGANYDDPPQYIYNPAEVGSYASLPPGQVPSCGGVSASTPYINLDEQSEIGLDQMFAAAGPGGQFAGDQILYLAKANRVEYDYVFQNGWYDGGAPTKDTATYVTTNKKSPPPGSTSLVSFPNDTIEIKAGWRRLTQAEMDSGRFYTAPVRFYQYQDSGQTYDGVPGDATKSCYVDAATGWGLVGLHIIRKTASAPYFIYATFEQADNLVDDNGNLVEDVNGNLVGSQALEPLTPVITSKNAVSANPPTPSSVQDLAPAMANSAPPANRLYYENTPDDTSEPQGLVYVNRRVHDIPETIIDVNETAHEAIATYNQNAGVASSPWEYYKLVNVQYQPIDKPTPGVDYTGDDVATYYQANVVVETDYNLQVFSGIFQPGTAMDNAPFNNVVDDPSNPSDTKNILGLITDFGLDGTPVSNVYFGDQGYNMGGCMGCHGNAQGFGSDFSFILLGGPVAEPEVGHPETPPNLDKFRLLLPNP